MADKTKAKFIARRVYHDGRSMQVKKAGDTGELTDAQVRTFLLEKAIEKPRGWTDPLSKPESYATADGNGSFAPTAGGETDLSQLDHDNDGEPGGSEPHDPPALTGKTKAQLLEIAEDEGVEVPEGATNAQIVEAIEAKRAEAPVVVADGQQTAPAAGEGGSDQAPTD